jgi:hypothetical protein
MADNSLFMLVRGKHGDWQACPERVPARVWVVRLEVGCETGPSRLEGGGVALPASRGAVVAEHKGPYAGTVAQRDQVDIVSNQ